MGSKSKPVHLKVFIDKKKNKVMFAEAEEDFVEILFSFLTLPLGTIARISSKHQGTKDVKVGSLDSFYQSVKNLDNKHFYNDLFKDALISPNSSSLYFCQKLKVDLNNTKPVDAHVSDSPCEVVFFKEKSSFFISDDLKVFPVKLDTSIPLLRSLGVEYIDLLEERTLDIGFDEFSCLLKWSLMTNTPLTNFVFGGSKACSCFRIKTSPTSNIPLLSRPSTQRQAVKLLIQKSKKKVLCAQAENFFVELLFSFLTIPLGNVKRLTMDNSSPTGIDHLYNSLSSLGNENYLKSDNIKNMLLCPKLGSDYLHVTDLLPIYEKSIRQGSFLKAQTTFIVSDDLEVTVSPSVLSTISKFNTLGIPVGDIEVIEVGIGEKEALLILKASLISTSALTDCLSSLSMENHEFKGQNGFID